MQYVDEVREMLTVWDSGGCITSVEMGGIGPGYEQAITIMAVEFARAGCEMPYSRTPADDFHDLCAEVLAGGLDARLGGATGAHVHAARSLAWLWLFTMGPDCVVAQCRKAEPVRMIMVTRDVPSGPVHDVGD